MGDLPILTATWSRDSPVVIAQVSVLSNLKLGDPCQTWTRVCQPPAGCTFNIMRYRTVPQQSNGVDCGCFAMVGVHCVCRVLLTGGDLCSLQLPAIVDRMALREHLAQECLKQKLVWPPQGTSGDKRLH